MLAVLTTSDTAEHALDLDAGRVQRRRDSQLVARMRQSVAWRDAAPHAVAARNFGWYANCASRHADAEPVLGLHDPDVRGPRRSVVEALSLTDPQSRGTHADFMYPDAELEKAANAIPVTGESAPCTSGRWSLAGER